MRIVLRSKNYLQSFTLALRYNKTDLFSQPFLFEEEGLTHPIMQHTGQQQYLSHQPAHQHLNNIHPKTRIPTPFQQIHPQSYPFQKPQNNNTASAQPHSHKHHHKHNKKDKQRHPNPKEHALLEQYPALNYLNQTVKANLSDEHPSEQLFKEQFPTPRTPLPHKQKKTKSQSDAQLLEQKADLKTTIPTLSPFFKNQDSNKVKELKKTQLDFERIITKIESEVNTLPKTQKKISTIKFLRLMAQSFKNNNPFQIEQPPKAKSTQKQMNINILEYDPVFKQCPNSITHDPFKREESLKYAYLYQLPYNLTQSDCQELIAHLEQTQSIKIVEHHLFPYKSYNPNIGHEISFALPQSYPQKQERIQKIYKQTDIQGYLSKSPKSKRKSCPKPQQKLSKTNKIITKIKTEDLLKFNKSSLLIKFQSKKEKELVVNNNTRLFGVNFKHLENVKIEQAYCKNTITLNGVRQGCHSQEVANALNKVLDPLGIPVQIEPCYLNRTEVQLEFRYFVDTLKALQALNNLKFHGKHLKAQLKYGPVKFFKGEFVPQDNENIQIVHKILQIRDQFLLKFEQEEQSLKQ